MISKPQKLFQEFRMLDSDCCLLSTIAAQWDSNLYFWLYFCFSCTKHPVQFLFFRKYLVVSLTQSKMVKLNSASSIFLRVHSQRVILSVPKYKWPEADFFFCCCGSGSISGQKRWPTYRGVPLYLCHGMKSRGSECTKRQRAITLLARLCTDCVP